MVTASVLVVEDEPTVARLIGLLLRDAGCSVSTAASAADGLELARSQEFDVVISKVELPDADGPQLAREVRMALDDRSPSVILTSIYGEPPRHDADDFIQRPFDPDRLLESVTRILAMRDSNGRNRSAS